MKMNEDLQQLLANLKLRRAAEVYEDHLRAAEKEDVTYSEFLSRLLRAQWQSSQETSLERRIQRARLPERWSLETFPFARQPGVSRKQIRAFAELDFVSKAEKHRLHRPHGRRQIRPRLRPSAQGPRKRLPLRIRQSPGLV